MSVDPAISVLQGTDIEPGLGASTSPGNTEILSRTLCIDWDQVVATNVRTFCSFRPEVLGLNNITYRLRDGAGPIATFTTLGPNLRDSATEVPGGPYTTFLDSGSIVKPTGLTAIQLTAEGIGGESNNTLGTVEMGIIPDTGGPIIGYSSLRGAYRNQPAPEAVVTNYIVDCDRFDSANIRVTIALHYVNFNFGDATLNLRQGGNYNTVDGTIIASNTTIPINTNQYRGLTAVIAKPVGLEEFKITQAGPFIQDVSAPTLWVQEA